jgi:RecB family exonuclease
LKKECWGIINKYLKLISEDKKNNVSANVLACEKNFELLVSDKVILNGQIDRVQLDDDNVIHVCDYKTVKNKKYLKNDFFQLLTYAYVIISEDPSIEKVRTSYILLRHDFEYITTEFSVPEILAIQDQYIKYAEQMLTEKEFPPNPTALCNFCDYLNNCPEGKTKAFNQNVYGEVNW